MMKFFISETGSPVAKSDDPKYEDLELFLMIEADRAGVASDWLRWIQKVQSGEVEEWVGGGEVCIIEMTRQSATISWAFDNPPPDSVYDFDEFVEIYHAWLDFLREHGRYPPRLANQSKQQDK